MGDTVPRLFDPVTADPPAQQSGESLAVLVLTTARSLLWSVGNTALVVWVLYIVLLLIPARIMERRAEVEHASLIEESQKRQIINQAIILTGQRKSIRGGEQ